MRYKHNVDLGDHILSQTPGYTCRTGIHPPPQLSETIESPEMEGHSLVENYTAIKGNKRGHITETTKFKLEVSDI